MTEHEHSAQTEQPAYAGSTLSLQAVGKLLVEARETAGLSVDDVAARLRLTPRQVQALESGEMDALPGIAFVRGFLRNYAKLLQIDAEPLLEACRTHIPDPAQSQISLHSENIPIVGRERKGWVVYLAASVIVVLALAGWLAYMDFSGNKNEQSLPVAEPLPQPLPEPAVTPQAMPAEPLPPVSMETAPATEQATVPQTPEAVPQPPVADAGTARLALASSRSSWVSVHDRDGKEIFSKTLPAGGRETVEGIPPLNVIVGNADGMQLTFNGKPVDMAPHTKANVARLTLE